MRLTKLTSDEPSGAKSGDNKGRGGRKWGQDDAGGDCTYEHKQVKALVGSTSSPATSPTALNPATTKAETTASGVRMMPVVIVPTNVNK